jgi:NAD(P)-dependent dehydrogenase (short-subunit alcohol dehydrogenase family)
MKPKTGWTQRFAGRVAVVTGAGQGIGRGIAVRLASEGATIVAVDRNAETAASTAKEVASLGVPALPFTVDVAVNAQLGVMVAQIVEKLQRIDVLVNCAGVHQTRHWLDITERDWDTLININLRGLFFCCQTVARQMIEQRSGRIVNIASVAGKRGGPYAAHYAVSKAGVICLTRAMAIGLARYNINVNCVCPGDVDTPMSRQTAIEREQLGITSPDERSNRYAGIPLGRSTNPEELSGLVAFLASDEAAYMTGQAINFSGGAEMR